MQRQDLPERLAWSSLGRGRPSGSRVFRRSRCKAIPLDLKGLFAKSGPASRGQCLLLSEHDMDPVRAERICTTQGRPETPGSRLEFQNPSRELSPELPSWDEVSNGARQLELRVEELQKQVFCTLLCCASACRWTYLYLKVMEELEQLAEQQQLLTKAPRACSNLRSCHVPCEGAVYIRSSRGSL